MARHDIVVIGGSAGALDPLNLIVDRLPPSLHACVLVVVHTRAKKDGALPGILAREPALCVSFAEATRQDRTKRRH